ncbi:hypothetical protein VTI74DRAFT_3459 [Chaetomium olivicolor]
MFLSRYSPLPSESNDSPSESNEDATLLLEKDASSEEENRWYPIRSLRASLAATVVLVLYTLAIAWITKAAVQGPCHHRLTAPLSSFPHSEEKQYVIMKTGQHGESWLRHLVYDKPSPEVDDAWYELLKPFNTRVPAKRYEATMGGRPSVRLADGSGDYYVTLNVYHEIHCLMRFRWFLDPGYYANASWEEQAQDARLMGHYRHCLWSLLESVLCNGDTSMRTFHWDPKKAGPSPRLPGREEMRELGVAARSRGCRFDILSFAWQTPECYDEELLDEFLRYDDWQFYAHPGGTDDDDDDNNSSHNTTLPEEVVDLATALEGRRTLYVDWKYHVAHCTFMWRQMHRAYARRGYIDSHLDDYAHTLHCQRTLLDRETPLHRVVVVAALKYPECRRIGGAEGRAPFSSSKGPVQGQY